MMATNPNQQKLSMNPIFKKLNYKEQRPIYVLNAPASFEPELEQMRTVTEVRDTLAALRARSARDFDSYALVAHQAPPPFAA